MTDERPFERLAAHPGPVAVDPGFEDRLYVLLQQGTRRSRRTLRPALLLVATLAAILTISAAMAVGSGVVDLWPDPSPTPSAEVIVLPTSSPPPSAASIPCSEGGPDAGQFCMHIGTGSWRTDQYAGDWRGDMTLGGWHQITVDGGCERNVLFSNDPTGPQSTMAPNTFRSTGAAVEGIPQFDGFIFEILDASAATAAGGTDQFWLGLHFRDGTQNIGIFPFQDVGTGLATLDDRGDTASMHIEGTWFGVAVTFDVACDAVTSW